MPLHVHTFGPPDGQPLLALPGLRGPGLVWRHLAETQLADMRVYAPDLRGQGSSVQEPPWTLEQHAADVLDTLDAIGLPEVDVVAQSFSGAVALSLNAAAPGRVRRLILLDPTIRVPAGVADVVARRALDERAEGGREEGDPAHPAAVVTGFSELARPLPDPPTGTAILFVVATRSPAWRGYLPDWQDALGADLTVVEVDCGHQVLVEEPERTGELIRAFVR